MKMQGFKIEGVTYFVTEKAVAEAGSLELAAKALKAAKDEKKKVVEPEPEKPKKTKKQVEEIETIPDSEI